MKSFGILKPTEKHFTGLTLKNVDGAEGKSFGALTGYASTFDIDLHGDRIMPGAWSKSIKEAVPAGRVKLIDAHNLYNGASAVIGKVVSAIEDTKGLIIEAVFASTSPAQQVRTLVQEGILSDFSVGFRIMRDGLNAVDKVREIYEAALVEVSVVAMPANPEARILRVKSAGTPYFKAAPADHEWNPSEAEARFKDWVNPAPLTEWGLKDWGLYSSGFLFATPEQRKWLLVDIVDGAPCYVVDACKAALVELREADSGPWVGERKSLEDTLKSVFHYAGAEFPTEDLVTLEADVRKALEHLRLSTLLLKMQR
jgi:HK97 family phage prohead protease